MKITYATKANRIQTEKAFEIRLVVGYAGDIIPAFQLKEEFFGMATPTVAKAKTVAAQADEAEAKQQRLAAAEAVEVPGISRREFLYYAWGASMALLLAQTSGLLIWFGLPRFREGDFGGTFTLSAGDLPQPGAAPADNPAGKFWLTYTENQEVVALYKVCTHLGCLYAWVGANDRFECPCHGSKFEADGRFIEGPAPRSLDRFEMTIITLSGAQLITNVAGDPIPVAASDIAEIRINTGSRIQRSGRI